MAEMIFSIEKNKLTADHLADFATSLPREAAVVIVTEERNVGQFSDDHREFVILKAEF